MSILTTLERNIDRHHACLLMSEQSLSDTKEYISEMRDISKTLSAIIKCEYQPSEFYDGENPSTKLDDESYITNLRKIHSTLAVDAKLRHIVCLIREIIDCVTDLRRKEAKLKDRIKLSTENTPEVIAARRKLNALRETIKGLGGRCDHLVKMFFDYRRAILNGVLGETEKLCNLFTTDYEVSNAFKEYYNKRIKAETFFSGHDALNMQMKKRGYK